MQTTVTSLKRAAFRALRNRYRQIMDAFFPLNVCISIYCLCVKNIQFYLGNLYIHESEKNKNKNKNNQPCKY